MGLPCALWTGKHRAARRPLPGFAYASDFFGDATPAPPIPCAALSKVSMHLNRRLPEIVGIIISTIRHVNALIPDSHRTL